MDFSDALRAMKDGRAVSHPDLDGFISATPGNAVPSEKIWSPHNRAAAKQVEQTGKLINVAPSITRCQPNGDAVIVMGWQPSQEDMFREDWGLCI